MIGSARAILFVRSFDTVSEEWLTKFVEHRLDDRRIIQPDPEMAQGRRPGRRDRDGQ